MKHPVFDKDLTSLLKTCENSELDPIVETILSLPSETLTKRPAFIEHRGDHKSYVDEIVYEITSLGGNTLTNLVRGHGVAYADMVNDVAVKLGVHPTETDTIATIEEKVILRVLRLGSAEMSDDDRTALADLLDLEERLDDGLTSGAAVQGSSEHESAEGREPGAAGDRVYVSMMNGQMAQLESAPADRFPEAVVSRRLADSGTSLLGDRIFTVVDHVARATRVRRTLVAAAKAALVKAVTSPLGSGISWAAALGKGLHDLMGPNYSASLALVAHVGLLRQKYEQIERDMVTEEVAGELASLRAS